MAEVVYTFEVVGEDLKELMERAYNKARALFGQETEIGWENFEAIQITQLATDFGGLVTLYEMDCSVRVQVNSPEPAVWFGALT